MGKKKGKGQQQQPGPGPQRPLSQAQASRDGQTPPSIQAQVQPSSSMPPAREMTQSFPMPTAPVATPLQGIQKTVRFPQPGRGRSQTICVAPSEITRGRGPRPSAEQMEMKVPVSASDTVQQIGALTLPSQPQPPAEVRAAQLARDLQESLSVSSYVPQISFIRRPGKGTLGKKFKIIGNHFKIQIPGGNVYHYDVTITPKQKSDSLEMKEGATFKKLRPLSLGFNRKLFEEFRKSNKEFKNCFPVYDGNKNLFTRKPLAITSEQSFSLTYLEEEKDKNGKPKASEFEVIIKPVRKKDKTCAINLDSLHGVVEGMTSTLNLDAIMAIEVILRHCPSLVFVPVGRSLYKPPSSPEEIYTLKNGGLDIWFGYHQSVHIGESGMFLNIDKAVTAFYPSIPLIELVQKILELQPNEMTLHPDEDEKIKQLSKDLIFLKVKTTHAIKRKYTIKKIGRSAKDTPVGEINVEKYFKEKYNIRLKYPLFPCVEVGTIEKPISLPMEVCHVIENQPHKAKLSRDQTSEIIKLTALKPSDRFKEIAKKINELDRVIEPVKKEYGIQVSKRPHEFVARKLPAPFVVYSGNQKVKADQGFWDLKNSQLYEAKYIITDWVIISFSYDRFCSLERLQEFAFKLKNQAIKLGIRMEKEKEIYIHKINLNNGAKSEVEFLIKKFKKQYENLQLIIFVLKTKLFKKEKPVYSMIYSSIKKTGDIDECLRTQCILDKNVNKSDPSLLNNLIQKINAKMGGINSTFVPEEKLEIFKKPVIIIGADVNHPAPGDKVKPSIAALVGSLDAHPSRYAATIRLQMRDSNLTSKLEIIQDLRGMIKDVLKEFYKTTRHKPERVIFFRDGVSEGQFQEVLDKEIEQIKLAFQDLSTGGIYNPPLTFVIIQKRHHTRLMPLEPSDGVGRCGNIPPGTTVDTDIVHPLNFDYYQCSHFGIQGTSRPTKYTVLYDDNKFTADQIQKLTHHLCHIYMRCTRSISLPAPVQYAHLAAFRAKEHLASLSQDSSSPNQEAMLNAVKLKDEFKKSMYFV